MAFFPDYRYAGFPAAKIELFFYKRTFFHRVHSFMKCFFYLCLFLSIWISAVLIHALPVSGQSLPLSIDGNAHFYRQLDALRWRYDTQLDLEQGNFELGFAHVFQSRLYLSEGIARNIQDENQMNVRLRQWLNKQWALAGEVNSLRFTNTNFRQDTGHIGFLYNPHKEIELSLLGGVMSDRRSNMLDQGWSGIFRARSRPFDIENFTFHPVAEVHYAQIDPREYATIRFHTGAEYQYDNLSLRGNFLVASGRRESYQPGSYFNRELRDLANIIESVRNDSTILDLRFRVPLYEGLSLEMDIYTLSNSRWVESRALEEDFDDFLYDTRTRRREIRLENYLDYTFRRSRMALGMALSYVNRDARLLNFEGIPDDQINRRKEILRNSDFDQIRFELFTQNRFRLSDHNELRFRAQTGILRYDTPELNMDDRDELSHLVMISNRHIFSPYFDITLHLAGETTHYVYLRSVRSIENNRRRNVRLSPVIRWQPANWLTLRNTLFVRANYTVADFQMEGRPVNDQASRELSLRSEAKAAVTQSWNIELSGSRSELRMGRLYWSTFQETPTDTLVTYQLDMMFGRESQRHRIAFGGRFYLRRDYLPQTTLTTEIPDEQGNLLPVSRTAPGLHLTRQYGPAVEIDLFFSSGNRVLISGWLQRQETWKRLYIDYQEEIAEAFKKEEQRKTLRIYPNMEIRAILAF